MQIRIRYRYVRTDADADANEDTGADTNPDTDTDIDTDTCADAGADANADATNLQPPACANEFQPSCKFRYTKKMVGELCLGNLTCLFVCIHSFKCLGSVTL